MKNKFKKRIKKILTGLLVLLAGITTGYSSNVKIAQAAVSIAGKAYQSESTMTPLANGTTITIYKNGSTLVGDSTVSGGDGSWSVSGSFASSDILTAYINNDATYKGAAVLVSDGTTQSNLNIYGGALTLRNDTGTGITNANIQTGYVNADPIDMVATTSGSTNLTVNTNYNLRVASSTTSTVTYRPGGTVTTQGTGDLRVATSSIAFLDTDNNTIAGDIIAYDSSLVYINKNTIVNGGDIKTQGAANTGNFLYSGGSFTPTVTLSGTGSIYDGNATSTFYNLTTAGSGTMTAASNIIIANNLTTSGGTLTGSGNVTVNGGSVTGNGTINMTGGTFLVDGTGTFGGNTNWTFNNLTFGDGAGVATTTSTGTNSITAATTTIAANQILDAGVGKTWAVTSNYNPLTVNGTFLASSSKVSFTAVSSTTTVPLANYYNLDFAPASGNPTYLLPAVPPPSASSIIQHVNNNGTASCGSTSSCVTSISSTGSGHLLVAFLVTSSGPGNITSVTGGGNWVVSPTGCYIFGTVGSIDCAYVLSSTPGVTSVTVNFGGSFHSQVEFYEISYPGTISFDTAGTRNATGANPQPGVGLTLGGTDIILQAGLNTATAGTSFSAISGAYNINDAYAIDSTYSSAYATALDTTDSSAPSWTQDLSRSFTGSALAFKITSNSASGGATTTVAGDLTIGGSGSAKVDAYTNNSPLTISGNMNIGTGNTFLAPTSSALTISGNFTNNGSFTHNNGTITFSPASISTVSSAADMSFYNLSIITPGKTLKFQKHAANIPTFTILNQMTVTGASADNPVYIESDTSGEQWMVSFSTPQTNITYASIKDSACAVGSLGVSNDGTISGRGNNGSCWNVANPGADGTQTVVSIEQGSGGGTVQGGGGTGGDGGGTEGGAGSDGGGSTQTGGNAGGGGGGTP